MGRFLLDFVRARAALRQKRPSKYLPETVAIIIAATAVPMVAGWVPPNPYYGFRTPSTMATPEEWYFANRLLGAYMIASQVVAVGSMSAISGMLEARFGSDRVTWGVLWSCGTALAGIGAGVLHYYIRG